MEQIKVDGYLINKNIYLSFINKIELAKNYQIVFTDFINPEEKAALLALCRQNDVNVNFYGDDNFERTVAKLFKLNDYAEYPIDVLKVEGNFKFERVEHRDYLGSLLSLGIKREKIGDINVFDDGAEIYILKELSDYVIFNLEKIKHTTVKIKKIGLNEAREKLIKFKTLSLNVPSLRLDAIISELTGESRNKASEIIKNENVKVNFKIIKETDKKVEPNSTISIKGYGRFIVGECLGATKSGRLVVEAKKII
ncbi:S4 domain protein [Caloramator mitchellensis]|uniref:S4 domain protein n=1 Tax=Caloramator mitchellensis TaxID=908809 RepID=A0A0R3K2M1_CALMK|nr:YlmH/Sll1252 family protein [Caloramator mitchellensis]KRQ86559.1 S4 domain protein [Caloramator mitchellensis]